MRRALEAGINFLDTGINFLDTGIVYQSGTSEAFLERALGDFARRDEVAVAM